LTRSIEWRTDMPMPDTSCRQTCVMHVACHVPSAICASKPCCVFHVGCHCLCDVCRTPHSVPNLAQALRCDATKVPQTVRWCPRVLVCCISWRRDAARVAQYAPLPSPRGPRLSSARRRRYGVVLCGCSVRCTLISYTKTSRPCCRLSLSRRIMRISSA